MASLAHVALHGALTAAAGHVAAPVVPAVAPLHHTICVGVVATAAAHEVTAVAAMGSLVALPDGEEMSENRRSRPTQLLSIPGTWGDFKECSPHVQAVPVCSNGCLWKSG